MAKAVLVMDMPEDCTMCKFWNSEDDECYATGVEQLSLSYCKEPKPDWCPLRELPKRKETLCTQKWYTNGCWSDNMKAGWNACLDAIKGHA